MYIYLYINVYVCVLPIICMPGAVLDKGASSHSQNIY